MADQPKFENTGRGQSRGGGGWRDQKPRRGGEDELRQNINGELGQYYGDILKPEKKDYNGFIDTVKKVVKNRAGDISSSQLRNVYSRIIDVKTPSELYLLRPKLAYAYGRAEKDKMKELLILLDDLIKEVKSPDALKQFKTFCEAIVAYHKYYEGK